MSIALDLYTLRARTAPALVVALPVALTVLTFIPSGAGTVWSLLAEAGVALLAGSVARKFGKDKQAALFANWGGRPSERLLSHAHSTNKLVLERRHNQLRLHLPHLSIPSAEEELRNPEAANQVYEACNEFLRNQTRKRQEFPLVFEENCNFGFSRNLYGMKKVGIVIAGCAVVTMGGRLLGQALAHESITALSVLLFAAAAILLLLWLIVITPNWVRVPADAYSERLLETLDLIK